MHPYDFQARAIETTLRYVHKNPVLVSPTGSGKTYMGCCLARRLDGPGLWVAQRTELIEQAVAALQQHTGEMVGIIKAGIQPSPLARVQVASKDTLIRRDMPRAQWVIIDECHHGAADSYDIVYERYSDVPIIGATATPFRLDGKGLGPRHGHIVVAAYADELCARGLLHEPKVYGGRAPSLQGVRISMGDYSMSGLAGKYDEKIVGNIIETWRARADGRRTVCFACDIEDSQYIVEEFLAAGVPAEHVDGTTSREERAAIQARLRSGKTLVVSNCQLWTEGVDIPMLECAILARPTASLNLHLQTIGRIMRLCDGKDGAIVLDHAGNHERHGRVTRRITYTLEGKCAGESDPLGLRRCGACQLLFDPKLDQCPDCGWKPSPQQRRALRNGTGHLDEYNEDYEFRREMWWQWKEQADSAGFKPGYAKFRYKERFGEWPVIVFGELLDIDNATMTQKEAVYLELRQTAADKGFKEGWASVRYKDIFGVWPNGFVGGIRKGEVLSRLAGKLGGVA